MTEQPTPIPPRPADSIFRRMLWLIAVAALAVELLVRPFWPELVKGESALSHIVQVLLALVGAGGM